MGGRRLRKHGAMGKGKRKKRVPVFFLLVRGCAHLASCEGSRRNQRGSEQRGWREKNGARGGGGSRKKGGRNNGSNRLFFSRRADEVRERERISLLSLSHLFFLALLYFTARTFSAGVAVAAVGMAGEERKRERTEEKKVSFLPRARMGASEQRSKKSVMKGEKKRKKHQNSKRTSDFSRSQKISSGFFFLLHLQQGLDPARAGNGRQQARGRGCGRRRRGRSSSSGDGASRDLIRRPGGGGRRWRRRRRCRRSDLLDRRCLPRRARGRARPPPPPRGALWRRIRGSCEFLCFSFSRERRGVLLFKKETGTHSFSLSLSKKTNAKH